jgi:hypothetical protein
MDMEEMKGAYERATQPSQPNRENVDINPEIIMKWLETKHSTLWSIWSITDEAGRQKASEWFYREIESLAHFTVAQAMVGGQA